jgi:hypothetical protein
MNELLRWSSFYILTSAAAATLIGLLFVVITLAANSLRESSNIRIYLTPIIYFASVLFIDLFTLIPYAGFPFVTYGLIVLGGGLMYHQPQLGLTCYSELMGDCYRSGLKPAL